MQEVATILPEEEEEDSMSPPPRSTLLEKKLQRQSTSSITTSSESSESSSSTRSSILMEDKKRVSFSDIEVVELPMILGDHPACRDGLPVCTSWKHSDRYSLSLDLFEQTRSPMRRQGSELYISSFDRLKLIRNIPRSPMTCPSRIPGRRTRPWKDDEILEKIAPPPMTLEDDTTTESSSSSRSSIRTALDGEIQRVEQRLTQANSRFDELTSRLDDLDLIRNERIQNRRIRRRKIVLTC